MVLPVKGNCLTYAVGMLLAEGFTGTLRMVFLPGPKVRFLYADSHGRVTYFCPKHPKRGWRAYAHLWFEGVVKSSSSTGRG